MATYMVRAMNQSDAEFDVFFKNSVIAVGWSHINFSACTDAEKLVAAVDEKYHSDGKTAPQVAGKKRNEIRRFKEMRARDHVVVPYRDAIRFAVLGEGERYDESMLETLDLCNQRPVSYLKIGREYVSVPRANLSEGLQRRLRVRGTTISDLSEFEEEIKRFFSDPQTSWLSHFTEAENKSGVVWQGKLLQNIRSGKTNLKAGGRGLEELIKCLLDLEGYKAEILSKRRFKDFADADIEANRSDLFGEQRLLVQVKHHSGQSNDWGAQQLAKILETEKEVFDEHILVLVTSADASPDLKDLCQRQDIRLIDGLSLVRWIYEHVDRLPSEWRASLGISRTGEVVFDA